MYLFKSLSLLVSLGSGLVLSVFAHTHQLIREAHHGRVVHASVPRNESVGDGGVRRRDGSGTFTYYAPGLGACGQVNSAGDFIVALNKEQFDGGSNCFKTITITYGGKSTTAQIVDECQGCGANNLDFSPSLFSFFAPLSLGQLSGSWVFGDATSTTTSSTSTTTTHKSTSTSASTPTTTSTSTTHSKTSSLSSISTSLTSQSSTNVAPTTTSVTSSAPTSTPTVIADSPENLANMNTAVIQLGSLIGSAAQMTLQTAEDD